MIKIRYFIFGLVFLLSSGFLSASNVSTEHLSERLLSQTGIDELLEQYPQMVKSGIAQRVKYVGAPESVARESAVLIDDSFNANDLNRELRLLLQSRFGAEELEAILSWYTGAVGQKIVQAELTGVSQNEYQTLQTSLADLQTQFRGSERERLFAAFDRATYATQNMVDSTAAIQVAMAAALSGVVKGSELPRFDEMRKTIESRRTAMRGVVGQQVYLNYLYTYQDISLEDMNGYIEFARSDLGARFFETLTTGLYDVLMSKSERLGQGLQASL